MMIVMMLMIIMINYDIDGEKKNDGIIVCNIDIQDKNSDQFLMMIVDYTMLQIAIRRSALK